MSDLIKKIGLLVDISGKGANPLPAYSTLFAMKSVAAFVERESRRHPLGVYHLSLMSINERISRFCASIESFYHEHKHADFDLLDRSNEVLENLQLCLYSAAEHIYVLTKIVSDVSEIYDAEIPFDMSKEFGKDIKRVKRIVAIIVNKIKHEQNSLRPFTLHVRQRSRQTLLLGIFLEEYHSGSINKSSLLEKEGIIGMSVSMMLWYIEKFLCESSKTLNEHLLRIKSIEKLGNQDNRFKPFEKSLIQACRFPHCSFDEGSDFLDGGVAIYGTNEQFIGMTSGLFGSSDSPWELGETTYFSRDSQFWRVDGISKVYDMRWPTKIGLERIYLLPEHENEYSEIEKTMTVRTSHTTWTIS